MLVQNLGNSRPLNTLTSPAPFENTDYFWFVYLLLAFYIGKGEKFSSHLGFAVSEHGKEFLKFPFQPIPVFGGVV